MTRARGRRTGLTCAAILALALVGGTGSGASPVAAADLADLVDTVPSAATPSVLDDGSGTASVQAIATVGSKVVLGGSFKRVANVGGSDLTASNLAIFDSATGLITSLPTVNGTVTTLLAGPKAGTVLLGGKFTKVNTTKVSNLALVDVATGKVVTSFVAPTFNDWVNDLALVGNHLLVGGKFRTVGGKARTALVSLSPTTGKDDAWVSIAFDGHHNWRGTTPTDAKAAVGIAKMATNPSGTQLVVVGNFTKVGGLARDQMAVVDLTAAKPRPSAWATTSLSSTCNRKKWDSWVRDVAVSADGTYAVVVSTGGPNAGTLCDAAARFALNTRARDVPPTWVSSTGGDTLISLALGERVVYVGGHMRWLNNSGGSNNARAGAVPRPSLAALDPATGLPYSWNPGRHPRGVGVSALLLTAQGLYVGSDSDYLGNEAYLRPRIALLPLASGSRLPSTTPPAAPDVYRAGATLAPGEVQRLHVGAGGADFVWPTTLSSGIDWSGVRGAFTVGDQLWTARADGSLVRQTFDGETFGAGVESRPWDDPVWSGQETGSGVAEVYLGAASSLADELPDVTALTYSGGRLYYTLSGSTALHVRWFNAESGIVADRSTVVRDVVVPTTTTGMFVQGSSVYLAGYDGTLSRRPLLGQTFGTDVAVVGGPGVDGVDWSAAVLFSGVGPAVP